MLQMPKHPSSISVQQFYNHGENIIFAVCSSVPFLLMRLCVLDYLYYALPLMRAAYCLGEGEDGRRGGVWEGKGSVGKKY